MKRKTRELLARSASIKADTVASGVLMKLPLVQILFDPHQPRKKIYPKRLQELAESIKHEGLQQPITVNFGFVKDDVTYYYINAGERRYRAHQLLGLQTIEAIVYPEPYNCENSVSRRLKQGAENFLREPHTHCEMINLIEDVLADEVKRRKTTWGSVDACAEKISQAFGQKTAWVKKYHTLAGLVPELREMMDNENEYDRLSFGIALALAKTPKEDQLSLLERSMVHLEKGGVGAAKAFIIRESRKIRIASGEKMRGRKYEERLMFESFGKQAFRLTEKFCGEERTALQQEAYVAGLFSGMDVIETEDIIRNMRFAMETFSLVARLGEAHRATLLEGVSV